MQSGRKGIVHPPKTNNSSPESAGGVFLWCNLGKRAENFFWKGWVAREEQGIVECVIVRSLYGGAGLAGVRRKLWWWLPVPRALYKEAPFIWPDEPTASWTLLPRRKFRIVRDKTAIYISHRLTVCRFRGESLVFHQGEKIFWRTQGQL